MVRVRPLRSYVEMTLFQREILDLTPDMTRLERNSTVSRNHNSTCFSCCGRTNLRFNTNLNHFFNIISRKYSSHRAYDSYLRSCLIEKEPKWAILFGIIGDLDNELGTFLSSHLKICLTCVNQYRCKVVKKP